MLGYIYVWEHSGEGRHIDADWSLIFEDLYSPELGFMDICVTNVFFFFFFFLASYDFRKHPHHSLCTLVDY